MRISVLDEPIVDSKIQIFDFNGRLFYSSDHSFVQNEAEIDLTGIAMSPGFYVVKMETESGVKVFRIVKE
jgi:hypothetical protein